MVITPLARFLFLHFGKFFITFVTEFRISIRGGEEFFDLLGEGLHQRAGGRPADDGPHGAEPPPAEPHGAD